MTHPVSWLRRWSCNIVAGLVIGLIGLAFYFLIDRKPPYEYLAGEIIPPEPGVGEQISVHWHVRVNRFCPGWVQRNITDRRGYVWRNVGGPVRDISPAKEGEERHIVNSFELPRQLGAGPAVYQAHVVFKCNVLQRWFWPIAVDTPSITFDIKP